MLPKMAKARAARAVCEQMFSFLATTMSKYTGLRFCKTKRTRTNYFVGKDQHISKIDKHCSVHSTPTSHYRVYAYIMTDGLDMQKVFYWRLRGMQCKHEGNMFASNGTCTCIL